MKNSKVYCKDCKQCLGSIQKSIEIDILAFDHWNKTGHTKFKADVHVELDGEGLKQYVEQIKAEAKEKEGLQ